MRVSATVVLGLALAAGMGGQVLAADAPAPGVRVTASALMAAVDRDDLASAEQIAKANPNLLAMRTTESGETPLHRCRSVAMAKLLLEHGADANARDREHNARPVRSAAANWRSDVVAFLEEKAGPDPDPFYMAATGKATELTQAIIEKPERLDERSKGNDALGGNRHLMHVAATYGQAACLKVLLEAGANVNEPGGWSNSQPLENAAWAGFPEAVKVLVENGADLEAKADTGHTALWYAAITGRREIVEMMLKAGAKPENGLLAAMRESLRSPYFGRALPKREDYDAVTELLKQYGAK